MQVVETLQKQAHSHTRTDTTACRACAKLLTQGPAITYSSPVLHVQFHSLNLRHRMTAQQTVACFIGLQSRQSNSEEGHVILPLCLCRAQLQHRSFTTIVSYSTKAPTSQLPSFKRPLNFSHDNVLGGGGGESNSVFHTAGAVCVHLPHIPQRMPVLRELENQEKNMCIINPTCKLIKRMKQVIW